MKGETTQAHGPQNEAEAASQVKPDGNMEAERSEVQRKPKGSREALGLGSQRESYDLGSPWGTQ